MFTSNYGSKRRPERLGSLMKIRFKFVFFEVINSSATSAHKSARRHCRCACLPSYCYTPTNHRNFTGDISFPPK